MASERFERVMAALRREEPDRVPWALWGHVPALRFLGRYSWEKAHRDGEELARAHLALLRMLDYKMDLLKVTPFYRYMSLIWGSRYRFVDNEEEVEGIDVVVKGPEDWGRLWVLDPRRELREHLWAVELLSRELGASTPFIYTIPSPLVQALHHVSTPERVYADMAEHPDALREGLRVIAESCIEFGRACLEEGATGIFYGVGSGGRYWSRMTREQLEEYALRYDRMVLKALRDAPIRLLHICSTRDEDPQKFGGLMEEGWFRHYPVDALNWWDAQFTPLEVAKGVYGDRFCLVGGLDQEGALKAGDPGEVEREARRAIEAAAEGGGFILAAGCTLHQRTPLSCFNAVGRAAERYGRYRW